MPKKHLKNDIAFGLLELDEPRCEHAVDEQSSTASLRMGPHYRMFGAREFAIERRQRLSSA